MLALKLHAVLMSLHPQSSEAERKQAGVYLPVLISSASLPVPLLQGLEQNWALSGASPNQKRPPQGQRQVPSSYCSDSNAQSGRYHCGVVPGVFFIREGSVLMTDGIKEHRGLRVSSSWPGLKCPGA